MKEKKWNKKKKITERRKITSMEEQMEEGRENTEEEWRKGNPSGGKSPGVSQGGKMEMRQTWRGRSGGKEARVDGK